jgi:histidinol-phosphate aminotransferase
VRISRRNLLRRIGAGAAVTAAAASAVDASSDAEWGGAWLPAGARGPGGPTRLNRNENAYGPSPKVMATIRDASRDVAHRYPGVEAETLRHKIAGFHGVAPAQVVLGCGSAEILRMAADAFVGPRKRLITAAPTFALMSDYARRAGADVIVVPLTRNYAHDLTAMLARSDAATGLVYICNPNNPTGTLTPRRDLDTFLRRLPATTCVLIDEAYHHYVGESADYASFIDHPVDDRRVVVARSFSTIYGLAGLRVGYAIAAAPTAHRLAAHGLQDQVNVIAAKAGVTALDDIDHVQSSARRNADDRQEFFNQANARMIRTIDSQANFVMINTGRAAVEVVEHFKKNHVLVSPPIPGFDQYVRVSLGTAAEMQEFWRVWDLMPAHKMSM